MELTSVIRGDVMNSRSVSQSNVWLKVLKEQLLRVGESPKTWEIFMGDSFQLEVKQITEVLSTAFLIKAAVKCIKGLDVKMAIGIGTKTYDAPRISESNGEVFIFSGELFDELKKNTLAVKSPWKDVNEKVNFNLDLILPVMNNWKPGTAKVVKAALEMSDATQTKLGNSLGISQGNVSEAMERARFKEIMALEEQFRELIQSRI